MRKKVLFLGMMVLVTLSFCLVGCGSSKYEEDSRNGLNKFINGEYDSMTEDEKDAVNNFLEWQSENH